MSEHHPQPYGQKTTLSFSFLSCNGLSDISLSPLESLVELTPFESESLLRSIPLLWVSGSQRKRSFGHGVDLCETAHTKCLVQWHHGKSLSVGVRNTWVCTSASPHVTRMAVGKVVVRLCIVVEELMFSWPPSWRKFGEWRGRDKMRSYFLGLKARKSSLP